MQLTQYTSIKGETSPVRDAAHKLGPYIKGKFLPTNPYNNKNDIKCDITSVQLRILKTL